MAGDPYLIGADHLYLSVCIAVAAYLTGQGEAEQLQQLARQVDQLQDVMVEMTHVGEG